MQGSAEVGSVSLEEEKRYVLRHHSLNSSLFTRVHGNGNLSGFGGIGFNDTPCTTFVDSMLTLFGEAALGGRTSFGMLLLRSLDEISEAGVDSTHPGVGKFLDTHPKLKHGGLR